MNVAAFDPSFRNWAVITAQVDPLDPRVFSVGEMHVEHTQSSNQGLKRDDDWRCVRQLTQALERYTHDATVIFAEQPVGSQSARASWTLGIALGVLASFKQPVVTFSARDVKLTFTGDPAASKHEMIRRAHRLHPELPWPTVKSGGKLVLNKGKAEHLADALAVLYCGLHSDFFQQEAA